jgi:hypothetical protein
MFDPSRYTSRPVVGEVSRISVSALLRKLQAEIKSENGGDDYLMSIGTDMEAEIMKGIMNEQSYKYEALEVPQHDTALRFDYVKSNLGKGYIFYFVCKCERRVSHLYQTTKDSPLGCRTCYQLRYKKAPSRQTNIGSNQIQQAQVITQQNKQVSNNFTDLNPPKTADYNEEFKKFLENE